MLNMFSYMLNTPSSNTCEILMVHGLDAMHPNAQPCWIHISWWHSAPPSLSSKANAKEHVASPAKK